MCHSKLHTCVMSYIYVDICRQFQYRMFVGLGVVLGTLDCSKHQEAMNRPVDTPGNDLEEGDVDSLICVEGVQAVRGTLIFTLHFALHFSLHFTISQFFFALPFILHKILNRAISFSITISRLTRALSL